MFRAQQDPLHRSSILECPQNLKEKKTYTYI